MDEEHSGDDKRGNNSFLMMANMIKPVMKAHLLNQGIFAYSWLYKQVRHKNAIFSKDMQNHDVVAQSRYIRYAMHATQRRREDGGPPKA